MTFIALTPDHVPYTFFLLLLAVLVNRVLPSLLRPIPSLPAAAPTALNVLAAATAVSRPSLPVLPSPSAAALHVLPRSRHPPRMFSSSFSSWASSDVADYQSHYPRQRDDPSLNDNFLFYSNRLRSQPDGDFVEAIHSKWSGDYRKLEWHHGYIQWLFPLRERGLNSRIHPLQPHEIRLMLDSPDCLRRVLASYHLMLDFYGYGVPEPETGALSVVSAARISDFISSSHNYLRITRILKSLGELGYERLKLGFVLRLWLESRGRRGTERMRRSCDEYWAAVLRDSRDREIMQAVTEDRLRITSEDEYREVLSRRQQEREEVDSNGRAGAEAAAEEENFTREPETGDEEKAKQPQQQSDEAKDARSKDEPREAREL